MHPILTDSQPRHHIVFPYNDEEKAINAVFLFANSGLSKQESVVLIMEDSHRKPIEGRLAAAGLDLAALRASGRLNCLSANSLLNVFVRAGVFDEAVFKETLTRAIVQAMGDSPVRKVRVFGELVSLLLAAGEPELAVRLEQSWNELIDSQSISLFCTYRLLDSKYDVLPDTLVHLHTHRLTPDCERLEHELE
ncbi:MAG TPA: MEDS domain-containing protein [Bryobacteraceae bacterium]|jgi:DcmR-like sensory protein|nr:MEDS domain-containing protein [Bryobacteraceae bacterium]